MSSTVSYKTVPNANAFYSLNEPSIGSAFSVVSVRHHRSIRQTGNNLQTENTPKLFQPITIRNIKFKNRIWVVSHALREKPHRHLIVCSHRCASILPTMEKLPTGILSTWV
jgi:hypothetical protein